MIKANIKISKKAKGKSVFWKPCAGFNEGSNTQPEFQYCCLTPPCPLPVTIFGALFISKRLLSQFFKNRKVRFNTTVHFRNFTLVFELRSIITFFETLHLAFHVHAQFSWCHTSCDYFTHERWKNLSWKGFKSVKTWDYKTSTFFATRLLSYVVSIVSKPAQESWC